MFIASNEIPMIVIQSIIILSTVSNLANAFDQCDVRGKFTNAKECKNKLPDSKCDHYSRLGYCIGQTYENMFIQCKRSCGFCIAPDLYEEIPKRTCFPERNEKYDMKVRAKMDCGNDKRCAAVVEAPKRRNQNKKSPYGNFSLTEKEYILCNYPLSTKATDDTLLFKKRGPSAACAHENIQDLSSYESMDEGGWDLEGIIQEDRLVLPGESCDAKLHRTKEYPWIVQNWFPAMISTTFWGSGRVTLKFENCNNQGEISVLVDGTEIANSKPNGEIPNATFNVEEGAVLEIKADNRAIIRLISLKIECGVSSTTLETRPAFDGYKYHESEYCSEPTYDNDASTIGEAVTKCTNDPDCAAIEDKWATGKPPIGLCKRKKGKRAGGGTYLLKKDIPAQDGVWTEWTPWTSCSHTCKPPPGELALKYRYRTCSNPPPALGGEDCKGHQDDVELCNQNNPCILCANSSVCEGKAGVTDDKGYCDFGESNSGICRYCSDVIGNCTDPATTATNGEQECEYICEGKCRTKDSDKCMQAVWSIYYTCERSKVWCSSWGKDVRRCCPETCNTGIFTEEECNSFSGHGTCIYPNDAQCPETN